MTYHLFHKVDSKYNNLQCIITTNLDHAMDFDEKNGIVMSSTFNSSWLLQKYFWRMIGDATFANKDLIQLTEGRVTTVIWNNTKINN